MSTGKTTKRRLVGVHIGPLFIGSQRRYEQALAEAEQRGRDATCRCDLMPQTRDEETRR